MKKIKTSNSIPRQKKSKCQKSIWKTILSVILVGAIGLLSIFLVFALYIVISSPDFDKKELYQKEPTILYDINGSELARIGTKDSTVVTYDELPEVLIDAIIATEDSRFFQHNGVDLVRFLKASFLQLLGSNHAGGASTLSMQVIKNTYTSSEASGIKGIIRKFTDIYMSVFKLEANYTKEEIIEFYLNSQWFANTGNINVSSGLWGVERASEWYFGKSVKDLNLAEASIMAGMFQNTRTTNPYNYPENCRKRQTTVLKLMVKHGYITESQMEAVLSIPISSMLANHEEDESAGSSQAFIDYVLSEVENKYDINPYAVSLKVYTTFDPKIQSVLEKVENGDFYKYPDEKVQEGIAVTSIDDGSLRGMSGGRDYKPKGTNYANVKNPPGSTAKPLFDYAMYIEHISQSTYAMFLDEETTYSNGTPISNYDRQYTGLITMRYALDDSRNIPALLAFKEVYKLDPNLIKDFVHSVGIDYGSELYESAAIGGLDKGISPIELSAAYGAFARGGYYIVPYSFTKIVNNETGDEYNNSYTKKQVMEESTAYMITNILLDAYGGLGPSGTTVAGKTGTTNLDGDTKDKYKLPGGALLDVWLVSYSPSYSIALWYGYDQIYEGAKENKYYLTSNTGGSARRKIMNELSKKIHKKNETFKKPKTVTTVNVEKETFPAQLCSEFTPTEMCIEEFFVRGTEPTDVSKRYSKLDNPTNGAASFDGSTITLTWDAISTPDTINTASLVDHFNKYYGNYSTKYYENRVIYNNTYIGTLGYEIYLQDSTGAEKYLGYTSSPTFTYSASSGNYKFIVKSAYSIFKNNMSTGLIIDAQANVQSPIEGIIGGNTTTDNNNNNNNNSNSIDELN